VSAVNHDAILHYTCLLFYSAKQKLELNQSKYRQLSAEIQRVEQEQQLLDGDKILLNE
jgi:hypothetical protein